VSVRKSLQGSVFLHMEYTFLIGCFLYASKMFVILPNYENICVHNILIIFIHYRIR
jgi:hypothetical protein